MNPFLIAAIAFGVVGLVFLLCQDWYDRSVTFREWGPPANYRFTYQFLFVVGVIALNVSFIATK